MKIHIMYKPLASYKIIYSHVIVVYGFHIHGSHIKFNIFNVILINIFFMTKGIKFQYTSVHYV